MLAELRDRYLDLLVGAVTHTLYRPIDTRPMPEEVQQAIREELERTGEVGSSCQVPWRSAPRDGTAPCTGRP